MQGDIGHRNAAHKDGLQARDRGYGAGTAHLDVDRQQFGRHFIRGKLIGNRPLGRFVGPGNLFLLLEIGDLENDPIDSPAERLALGRHLRECRLDAFKAADAFHVRADPETEGFQEVEDGHLIGEGMVFGTVDAVSKERQPAGGGDLGVELADRAGGAIARIDERTLAGSHQPRIHLGEIGIEHHHLATHLDGQRLWQAERDRRYRADLCRDLFTCFAIAARRGTNQESVVVGQGNGQTVVFVLTAVLDRLDVNPQRVGTALRETPSFSLVHCVCQRQHRGTVRHSFKFLQRDAANPLRWRIGRHEFGMLRLQPF